MFSPSMAAAVKNSKAQENRPWDKQDSAFLMGRLTVVLVISTNMYISVSLLTPKTLAQSEPDQT